jgi:hypothetical protein
VSDTPLVKNGVGRNNIVKIKVVKTTN